MMALHAGPIRIDTLLLLDSYNRGATESGEIFVSSPTVTY